MVSSDKICGEKKVDIGDKKRFVKVLGRRKVNLVDLHLPAERKF